MASIVGALRTTYKAVVPEQVRDRFERARDLAKAARFWANPIARRRHYEELEQCETAEQCFDFTVQRLGPQQMQGEILGLLGVARGIAPVRVCEIGTAAGGTNMLLSQSLPSVSLMIGVDLYVKNKAQLRYYARPWQRLHYVDGSSRDPATIARVRKLLGPNKLDLLFIDGDHSYEGVKADFFNFKDFVREGGLIGFHDIVPDHFTQRGVRTDAWVGDVPTFWKQLAPSYTTQEIVSDPKQDGCGIGLITYSEKVHLREDAFRLGQAPNARG